MGMTCTTLVPFPTMLEELLVFVLLTPILSVQNKKIITSISMCHWLMPAQLINKAIDLLFMNSCKIIILGHGQELGQLR